MDDVKCLPNQAEGEEQDENQAGEDTSCERQDDHLEGGGQDDHKEEGDQGDHPQDEGQAEQQMDEGPADQTDAVDKDGRAGSVSCEISMQSRLPTPQVWAPQGGRCPRTLVTITTFNPIIIEEQPENTAEEDTTTKEAKKTSQEEGVWVKGADQEENKRYAGFLNYLEERRQEMKAILERDEERIAMAKKKSST